MCDDYIAMEDYGIEPISEEEIELEDIEAYACEIEAVRARACSKLRPLWVWLAFHAPTYRMREDCAYRAGFFDR